MKRLGHEWVDLSCNGMESCPSNIVGKPIPVPVYGWSTHFGNSCLIRQIHRKLELRRQPFRWELRLKLVIWLWPFKSSAFRIGRGKRNLLSSHQGRFLGKLVGQSSNLIRQHLDKLTMLILPKVPHCPPSHYLTWLAVYRPEYERILVRCTVLRPRRRGATDWRSNPPNQKLLPLLSPLPAP